MSSKAKAKTAEVKAKPAAKAKAKPTTAKAKPTATSAVKQATKTSKPGAATKASKPAVKASKPAVKASKPAVKATKPAVKATKPAVKASKPAVKASKPAAKASKPAAKAAKPAAKAAKPAAKAAKPAAKAAKPAAKTAKPAAKTAKPAAKTAKPAAKTAKPAAKTAKATSARAAATSTSSSPAAKSSAPASGTAVGAAKLRASVVMAPVPRSGRVSARLAQLTVPTMEQTVASTAAKASYSQIMSSPVIVPVPVAIPKDPKLANNWKNKSGEELSDAELKSMPDSEYMNDKQLAAFRIRLTQLKQDILNNAGETTEHLREDTVIVPDPADRATIEEEHALELRTRDRERKLLKKIEQSISRIDAGDYGYCDETGEPIGVGRLLARPTATLSLEAQQRRELKQKMFGD
ncbi:MAG: RNA polymerase-binding protein DksA [Hylemonella sp.]|nr:RNA polymerase-binding protein DksA [Hylemonella sp.]